MPSAATPAATLPVGLKAAWGFGSVGTATVINVGSLLLLFFMTAVLGIAPALAGTLLFAAKLCDAVAAPLVGGWSDRSTHRWGRRAPYMMAGAVITAAGVALVLNPPALTGGTLSAYLFGCLMVLALGYSLFNVPYIAMPPEMTDLPAERTSILSWRIAFVSIGGLLGGLAPQFAKSWGGGRVGYGRVGLLLGLLVLAAMLVASLAARRTRSLPPGLQTPGFARYAAVFANRPFRLIIAAKICQLVGLASVTASLLFLVNTVLKAPPNVVAILILASTVATLVAMPLWVRLGRSYSKRNLYALGCAGYAVLVSSWLLAGPGEPVALIVARGVVSGLCSGGLLLMGQSLLPDIIDHDCRRTGVRREGLYAGVYSFVEKASMAFGPLLVGLILQAFHFRPSTGGAPVAQPPEALTGIYLGAAVLPAALYLLSIVPLMFIDLERDTARQDGDALGVPAT